MSQSKQKMPTRYRGRDNEHVVSLSSGHRLHRIYCRPLSIAWYNLTGPQPAQGTRLQNTWRELTTRFADERWESLGFPELVGLWRDMGKQNGNRPAP